MCQSHTGHMTGLWFLPARPLRLNTNEWMNIRGMAEISQEVQIHMMVVVMVLYEANQTAFANHQSHYTKQPKRWKFTSLQAPKSLYEFSHLTIKAEWLCRVHKHRWHQTVIPLLSYNTGFYLPIFIITLNVQQWRTERGGVWDVQTPPEILKALQNHAKLNPNVKTVKNCWI